MNQRFIKMKLLYPNNEKHKEKKIFSNSLSVNNIKPIKSINTNNLSVINKNDKKFASQGNINVNQIFQKKIKLPKILINKGNKNDKNVMKSNLIDIKNKNFFMTEQGKLMMNKQKIKIIKHVKKRGGNKKEENEEPLFNLDSLIEKFDAEYIIAAINKQNNQRSKLNKLYGITSAYIRKINKAKKRKYLPLKKYQSNILNAYSFNEKNSEESIRDLSNQFNFIREDSESIVPFPKINIKTMFNHIKNKENKEKILSVKSYINQIPEPKDEYEKEEQLIQSLRARRKNFRNLKIKSVPNF